MGLCLRADLGSGKSEVCLQRRELGGGQRRVAREQLQRGVVGALAEPTRVTCPPSRLEPGRPLGGRRVLVSGPEIWLSPPPQSFLVPGCPNVLGTQLRPGGRSEARRWPLASQGPALLAARGDTGQRPRGANSPLQAAPPGCVFCGSFSLFPAVPRGRLWGTGHGAAQVWGQPVGRSRPWLWDSHPGRSTESQSPARSGPVPSVPRMSSGKWSTLSGPPL